MVDTITLADILNTEAFPTGDNLKTGSDKINANNALIETELNKVKYGTGTPEGAVTASINTRYVRIDDSTIWIKTTASGSTGWKKLLRSGEDNLFTVLQGYATALTPTDDKHLTTKKYVTDSITNAIAAIVVPDQVGLYVPFSVNSGYIASGYPDLIAKVGSSDTEVSYKVDDGETYEPFVCTYPDGTTETSTSLSNTTGIPDANATYIFIKEKGDSTPKYTTAFTVGLGAPSGGSSGDYYLDISVKPHVPYKNISGTWTITQFVAIGQAINTGGTPTLGTPITYAYNGLYISDWFAASTAQAYVKAHNLGTNLFTTNLYYSASSAGTDAVDVTFYSDNMAGHYGSSIKSITTVDATVNTGNGYVVLYANGAGIAYATSGYMRLICKRSF